MMKKIPGLLIVGFIVAQCFFTSTCFAQLAEAKKLSPVVPKMSSQSRPSLIPVYGIAVIALLGVVAVMARSSHRGTRQGGREES